MLGAYTDSAGASRWSTEHEANSVEGDLYSQPFSLDSAIASHFSYVRICAIDVVISNLAPAKLQIYRFW